MRECTNCGGTGVSPNDDGNGTILCEICCGTCEVHIEELDTMFNWISDDEDQLEKELEKHNEYMHTKYGKEFIEKVSSELERLLEEDLENQFKDFVKVGDDEVELKVKDRVSIINEKGEVLSTGKIYNINDFREPSMEYAVDVDGYNEDVLFFGRWQLIKIDKE